ncbi:MAG: hypothetical protein R3F56_10830 [Planctomycetota bacterium]
MSYDPRTIAFLAEILFQPVTLQAERVQQIHNSLFSRREIAYQNFQIAQDGIHLSNLVQTPGAVSVATFLPDRIVVREELRSTTVEDFATRLVNLSSLSFQVLGIRSSVAQQFVVRSLVTPRHWASSTELLAHGMLSQGDDALASFGRPLQAMGVRLTFPQAEGHGETFNLRFETWTQDPRSLWIENTGSFASATTTENLPALSNYLYSTYRFLTQKACSFLELFDKK